MANKKSDRPAEFPSDWHYETHLVDLERELAGRNARLAELRALNAHPDMLAQTETEIDAVRGQLEHYGVKAAGKRPAQKGSTR